jgi:hypothetical protein
MTTSGAITFNQNRDQIIKAALRKLAVINASETPGAQLVSDCADQLNMLLKALNATGLHVWTESEATLFLQLGQVSYTIGSGSTDHCAPSYTATTLASAAALSATTISLTSTSGFAASGVVGVVGDDGVIIWTTQSGSPSGSNITLASGLTDSASAGNAVYTYTANIDRPLRVPSARRYNFPSLIDTQMIALSRIDYRNLPNKTSTGVPTQFFYDPRGGANAAGVFYVWPAPAGPSDGIKLTYYRQIQDFSTSANTPDLPQEWLDALVWNLALKMAPEFDCTPNRYAMIKEHAVASLESVMGWDREPESYYFGFNADQTQ